MPKGYIRLANIKKPIVGMPVVSYEDSSSCSYITKIIDEFIVKVNDKKDGIGFGIERNISELKQLVVEYKTGKGRRYSFDMDGEKIQLPIKFSRWDKILEDEIIDKEINFEIKLIYDIDVSRCKCVGTNCEKYDSTDCNFLEVADVVYQRTLPNPYSGDLNTERIKAYRRISDLYTIEESTIREIFCKGIDWYREKAETSL